MSNKLVSKWTVASCLLAVFMALFVITSSTVTKTPPGDLNKIELPTDPVTSQIPLWDRLRARFADIRADFWETMGFDATVDRVEAKRLRRQGQFRKGAFVEGDHLNIDQGVSMEEENVFGPHYAPEELRNIVAGEDRLIRQRRHELRESVKEGIDIIKGGVQDKWHDLHDDWHHAKDKVEDDAREAMYKARNKIHHAKDKVEEVARETSDAALDTWHHAVDVIEDVGIKAKEEVLEKWNEAKNTLAQVNERVQDLNEGRGLFYPLLTVISIVCAIVAFGTPNLRERILNFGERHSRFDREEFKQDAKEFQQKAKATMYDARSRVEEAFGRARRKAH